MLHASVTLVAAWRLGWRPGAGAGWKHPGVRQVGNLLLPRTVGQSVTQINQLVNIPIATRLGPGNLSMFRWANDIQDVPISIIGVTMATVSFPIFVELLSQNKKEEFIQHFSAIVRQILFLIIPITVLFIQLRAQFVRLIIGAGEISWPVTIATAQTVAYFAVSFFAQALIPVLARSFYAMQDTKTPVRITVAAVGLDVVGSLILGPIMGVEGLALSFTISSIISAAWLLIALHRRVGHLDEERIFSSVLKILGVTMMMGLTVQGTKYFLESFGLVLTSGFAVLVQAVVAGGVGIFAYIVFSILFRIEEASMLSRGWEMLRALVRPANGKGTSA
jgi:putative peptidoglycan lipid II flippase